MSKENRRVLQTPEVYPVPRIYEHLFPGNLYRDLPFSMGRAAITVFDLYSSLEGFRNLGMLAANLSDSEFVERQNLTPPDKFTMKVKLRHLRPLDAYPRGSQMFGHDFGDEIDVLQGEKLGGAASRPVPKMDPYSPSVLLGIYKMEYTRHDEIVIGILDKDGKPAGIIHFMEGTNPPKKKRKKERGVIFVAGPNGRTLQI